MADEEGSGGWNIGGILVFLLIFGLGNVILYYTTGFVIIPIK